MYHQYLNLPRIWLHRYRFAEVNMGEKEKEGKGKKSKEVKARCG
jgi:hypothetical protein